MLNLLNNEPDNDKVYSYAKNPNEAKYNLLISKREKKGLKHFNDSKAFIEYSLDMNIFIKILNNAIQIKKRKMLILFNDMIVDMPNTKNLHAIVTELFIRGRKLYFFSYFY